MPGPEMTGLPPTQAITREYLAGVRRRRYEVKAKLSALAHRDRRLAETLLAVCEDLQILGDAAETAARNASARAQAEQVIDQLEAEVAAAEATEALRAEQAWGQPAPVPNDGASMHDLVIADMASRKAFGLAKYGTPLQIGNGRDGLQDAYEEALDLIVYLRQEIEERRQRAAGKASRAAAVAERFKAGQVFL